jgi:hypothetical protein
MTTTKVKPTETIGDDLPILAFQIKRIMANCAYEVDTKNEWVQWATGDVNRTSLKSITQAEAKKIIRQQEGLPEAKQPTDNWASFTPTKPNPQKRSVLFSHMYQAQWTKPSEKHGDVPDLERLSQFLKSEKSPVNKKLVEFTDIEMDKLITAFKGIVKSKWK